MDKFKQIDQISHYLASPQGRETAESVVNAAIQVEEHLLGAEGWLLVNGTLNLDKLLESAKDDDNGPTYLAGMDVYGKHLLEQKTANDVGEKNPVIDRRISLRQNIIATVRDATMLQLHAESAAYPSE